MNAQHRWNGAPSEGRETFGRAPRRAGASPVLADTIRVALRAAVCLGPSDPEACQAMQRVCAVAQDEGLLPEQLLIALKECWQEVPEPRAIFGEARESTLSNVVTQCIELYFAP